MLSHNMDKILVKLVYYYGLITWLPLFFKVLVYFLTLRHTVEEMTELINSLLTNLVIPWWFDPLQFLSNIPGSIGALITVGFILFLANKDLL